MQTENALAALARLSYSQMDGTVLTESDFEGVLSKMPFTSDQEEAQMSHKILLEQVAKPDSIVNSDKFKPLVQ